MKTNYRQLEKSIGYRFRDRSRLLAALTHPSARQKEQQLGADYERLEFLGDAALNLMAAEWLYRRQPQMSEGEMTRLRSVLTNARTLKKVAQQLAFADYLTMGPAERASLGKGKTSILSDALEALLGAVYLDGGYRALRKVFERVMGAELQAAVESLLEHNPKGALQELLQKQGLPLPRYRVAKREGPDHEPAYTVEVLVQGQVLGRGCAGSKKTAEMQAAEMALHKLGHRRKQAEG